MFGIQHPLAHKDSTRLPPISQLISREGPSQYDWPHSSPPSALFNLRMPASDDEPISSVEMQEHRSSDASIEPTPTDMGLPYNPSKLLASDENASNDLPVSVERREIGQRQGDTRLPPEEQRLPELGQDMSSSFLHSSEKQSTRSLDTEVDAMFLLSVLSLGDVEMANGTPTLKDLHAHLPVEPMLREKTIASLLKLQLSDQIICLGAALIPRACCLRRSSPIFPHDCPWYDEEEQPLATIAVALRVAQLYLDREAFDTGTFYMAWGFYPYEDLPRFARKLGDPENKTPIVSKDWDQWCALKREFEKAPEFIESEFDVTPKGHG